VTTEDMIQRCREAAQKQDDAAAKLIKEWDPDYPTSGHDLGLHQGAAIAYRRL